MVTAQYRVFYRPLCERIRKGIMDGLRNFIKVDKHCALEVVQGRLRYEDQSANQGRSRGGVDAQNRGSGLSEIVYQY